MGYDSKIMARSARRFRSDRRGEALGMGAMSVVVAVLVGGITAAFLLPLGAEFVTGAAHSSWSSGALALWELFEQVMALTVIVFFVAVALQYR